MKRTKIKTLEDLLKVKSDGYKIIYDNNMSTGVVRRVESNPEFHLIVVKLDVGTEGLTNLSEFKYYKTKPKDIYLNSFYFDEPETEAEKLLLRNKETA